MSVQATSWAWEQSDIYQSEKLVLLYLADKAGDNGISWHSRARISEHCLYKDPKSIQKIMSKLEAKGKIKRFKRFTENGDQSSNYVVVMFEDRDTSDDHTFLKKGYEHSETPVNKGGVISPPPKTPVNKGGSIQPPPGVYTAPTGGSHSPPKRNRTVIESVSESVNTTAPENFSDLVMAELLADNLPAEHKRYAGLKIQEYTGRFGATSIADCWSYVVQAVNHRQG